MGALAKALFTVTVLVTPLSLSPLAVLVDSWTHQSLTAGTLWVEKTNGSIDQLDVASLYRTNCRSCHDVDGTGKRKRAKMPTTPDFTNLDWQLSHTEQGITEVIREGSPPSMPAYRDKLEEQEILALAFYIRSFSIRAKELAAVTSGQLDTASILSLLGIGSIIPPKTQGMQKSPSASTSQLIPAQTGPTTPRAGQPLATSASVKTAVPSNPATGLYRQYCLVCHGVDGKGSEVKASMPIIPNFARGAWQEKVSDADLVASILDGKGTLMPAFQGRLSDDQAQELAAYVRTFGPASGPSPKAPATDFEKEFKKVRAHWGELQRQLDEISKARVRH